MTRQYNQIYQCANCGCSTTTETSLGRWIRNNPKLDSRNGLVVYDIDYVVHKYKTMERPGKPSREFQLIMLIEVKTRNSDVSQEQRDTLYILNQIIENRRTNKETTETMQSNRHRQSEGPLRVWSAKSQKYVYVRSLGVHKLVFSGTGPDDSENIFWDNKKIDIDTLEKLINLDVHPDSFKEITEYLRSHHKNKNQTQMTLLGTEDDHTH